MKISESWLREGVDLSGISRATLLEKLTAAGLEVESCEPVAAPFTGVCVAQIVACEKHPDAERLRVCSVDAGEAQPLSIVCGAANARTGLKAPLARVGAQLPGGLNIKVGKLRGVESFGMLCSTTELGLPAYVDGLFELPDDAPVGTDIRDYLGLDDSIIELKMTPNRSDCLGVLGLLRELSALFGRPLKLAEPAAIALQSDQVRSIVLSDVAACPRYLGRVIEAIDPHAQTPLWMRERLRRSGLRAIHPVVDITNYVLLELGQPMHGFDLDKLNGAIEVRRARPGERVKLLDEQTVSVDDSFLLIADADGPLALAGIMGGYESRVGSATCNIFLEAAHFSPPSIMGRARKLGLHTDASHRFERGVDPALPELALARATELVLAICGGRAGPVCRAGNEPALPEPAQILLRAARLEQALGVIVPADAVVQILQGLGFAVRSTPEGWRVQASTARFDIAIEADLIEEVARIWGYERIPVSLPELALVPLAQPEGTRPSSEIRRLLAARDFQEAITLAFVGSQLLKTWGMLGHSIKNPLSNDVDVMRPALLPGLLQAVSANQRRQVERVRLFEIGVVFLQQGKQEINHLAGVACGNADAEQWGVNARPVDFYDIKGTVEALLAGTGQAEHFSFEPAEVAWLHPGRSAQVRLDGKVVGVLGQLHPQLSKDLDLRGSTLVFELALSVLQGRKVPRAALLSKFPRVRRDLAIVLSRDITFARLSECLKAAAGPLLVGLECFDDYRGPGLDSTCKSLAIGLILQDLSRTLGEQEVDLAIAACVAAIARDLGGSIRS